MVERDGARPLGSTVDEVRNRGMRHTGGSRQLMPRPPAGLTRRPQSIHPHPSEFPNARHVLKMNDNPFTVNGGWGSLVRATVEGALSIAQVQSTLPGRE